MAREQIAGPEGGPQPPFPVKLSGKIISGFGRGSKELGIPTANIPIEGLSIGGKQDLESGVYFGWAGLCRNSSNGSHTSKPKVDTHDLAESTKKAVDVTINALSGAAEDAHGAAEARDPKEKEAIAIFPAVLSVGYNPYYKNTKRSLEIHLIHQFKEDFYGSMMNVSILAFIRGEEDYDSLEALIEDIKMDIVVAGNSLEREGYAEQAQDPWLVDFDWDLEKGR